MPKNNFSFSSSPSNRNHNIPLRSGADLSGLFLSDQVIDRSSHITEQGHSLAVQQQFNLPCKVQTVSVLYASQELRPPEANISDF